MRRQDEEKKSRIKNAVVKVVLEEGLSGVSISKIAKSAGVSPATVYVYYESKDDMMKSMLMEYASMLWQAVQENVTLEQSGQQIIDTLAHNYYHYMVRHEMEFSFVEQFLSCPAFARNFSEQEQIQQILVLFQELKQRKVFKSYNDTNLFAILFGSIKMLRISNTVYSVGDEAMLGELIKILQDTILQ